MNKISKGEKKYTHFYFCHRTEKMVYWGQEDDLMSKHEESDSDNDDNDLQINAQANPQTNTQTNTQTNPTPYTQPNQTPSTQTKTQHIQKTQPSQINNESYFDFMYQSKRWTCFIFFLSLLLFVYFAFQLVDKQLYHRAKLSLLHSRATHSSDHMDILDLKENFFTAANHLEYLVRHT